MFTKYLQALRAAGASMRAGGIAMRRGYGNTYQDFEIERKTKSLPPIYGGFDQDRAKLAGDWRNVGNDVRRAMEKVGKNEPGK